MTFLDRCKYNLFHFLFSDKLSAPEHVHHEQAYHIHKVERNYKTSLVLRVIACFINFLMLVGEVYLIKNNIYNEADGIYQMVFYHIIMIGIIAMDILVCSLVKNKSLRFKKYFYWWFVVIVLVSCTNLSIIELKGEKNLVVFLIGIASMSISFIFDKLERLIIYGSTLLFVTIYFYYAANIDELFIVYMNTLPFLILGFVITMINSASHRDLFLNRKIIEQKNGELAEKNLELKKILNNLEESNENLERFAAMAAHDLKAPLITISGFSQILFEKYKTKLPAEHKKMFDYIVDDCNSLKALIDGLLVYSLAAQEEYKIESVNLNDVVNKVSSLLRFSIQNAEAEIIVKNNLLTVQGQRSLIEQLFLNLINNALKFRTQDKPATIVIMCEIIEDGFVKIGISDNGIGIENKYHQTIFKVFERLHGSRQYKGNGIGLATCHRIVTSFGGNIWVESEIGEGSTFYFTLKLVDVPVLEYA